MACRSLILLLLLLVVSPARAESIINALWSQDGTHIVYERPSARSVELWAVKPDGSGARVLHTFPMPAVYTTFDILGWTPDGADALVGETRHDKSRDGTSPRTCLWQVPMRLEGKTVPWKRGYVRDAFVPGVQGEHVCLALDATFNSAPGAGGYVAATNIEITDLDGQVQNKLSYERPEELIRWPWSVFGNQTNLSPDGRWVLSVQGLSLSGIDVVARTVDGQTRQVLDTGITLPDQSTESGSEDYRWTQASSEVVLALGGNHKQLYRCNLDQGSRELISALPMPDQAQMTGLSLSPDGQQAAYTWSLGPGEGALHLLRFGQATARDIVMSTTGSVVSIGPYAWRDNRILVSLTPKNGLTSLYVVSEDGTRKVKLTR